MFILPFLPFTCDLIIFSPQQNVDGSHDPVFTDYKYGHVDQSPPFKSKLTTYFIDSLLN